MKPIIISSVATLCMLGLSAGHAASPPDIAASEAALAKDRDNPRLLSNLGDARFLNEDEAAYQSYTMAWNYTLKDAWDATKGDSPMWKALAYGVAALGVATDVVNAKQGVTSNYAAESLDTSSKMIATLEETTGNKDNRKNVKRVMVDLKALAKRESSSYRIIFPVDNRVAGAAMARVHSPNGVCNAVRVDASKYAVSSACLAKYGAPTGVSINTTLRPEDFAKVSSLHPEGDQTIVAVEPVDGEVATESWHPFSPDVGRNAAKPEAWGVTWFAPEFDFIVPVFESCSSSRFDDCGDVHGNNAILWVRQDGAWKFYGFATPEGKIVSNYVAALH